jgi:hypothetical protein
MGDLVPGDAGGSVGHARRVYGRRYRPRRPITAPAATRRRAVRPV